MAVFIILLIAAVVLFFVVRKNKRKKAIEDLKNRAGHEVAIKIKDELSMKGYKISALDTFFENGKALGSYYVRSDESKSLGRITFCTNSWGLMYQEYNLRQDNIKERMSHYYAIENANIGLLVISNEKSKTIPPVIEVAAEVIKNSGYDFKHPDWLNEHPEAREYLNVMFQ
jgi:hypothetical protein